MSKHKWRATDKTTIDKIWMKERATGNGQGIEHNHKGRRYCPECHAYGFSPHKKTCKYGCWIILPPTAQLPKSNASKKTWRLFNERYMQLDRKIKQQQQQQYYIHMRRYSQHV
jgi:hypothetical protein